MRETADSRAEVFRTTLVFCFLPTSSQPSEGEDGRPMATASPLASEGVLLDLLVDSLRATNCKISSWRVSIKKPRNSSASS